MGIVGKYLDAISDEQRDRVIEAKDFYDGTEDFFWDGCGCLVGVAEMVFVGGADPINDAVLRASDYYACPASRFPKLCRRFGKDRIVAACKKRAAKGNRLHEIRSEVYRELVPVGGMNGWVQ